MSLGSIGAVLLVLVAVFIFSRVWFHFVESILRILKRILCKKAPPPAWHTLAVEPDREEKEDVIP